jgi:hypothetical protein
MMTGDVFDIAQQMRDWAKSGEVRRRVSRRVSRIVRHVDDTAQARYITGRGAWTEWHVAQPDGPGESVIGKLRAVLTSGLGNDPDMYRWDVVVEGVHIVVCLYRDEHGNATIRLFDVT